MISWTNAKLCDLANLVLACVLFFSPWLFSFPTGSVSRDAAYMSGIAIAVISIGALAAFAVWEEWLNLFLGLWVLISPWFLKFQDTNAMPVFVVIGAIIAVLAAIELWLMHQNPPRLTTS